MTPIDKAIQIINFYTYYVNKINIKGKVDYKFERKNTYQCALFLVNEIIPLVESYENALSPSQTSDELEYWYEIKQIIEKLNRYE